MIKLKNIIDNVDYKTLNSDMDRNLFESYALMGELLNPNNAYFYEEKLKGYWEFKDRFGYDFFVRLTYQPLKIPYFEMKMGWSDLDNQQRYLKQPVREIDEKRSDTIAKIFRDELIPSFLKQELSNVLKIFPLDIKRYQFSIRMVSKFTPNDKIDIIENKPIEISLVKKI